MSLKALLYAYVLGGLTFVPLVIIAFVCFTVYTSVPVSVKDVQNEARVRPEQKEQAGDSEDTSSTLAKSPSFSELNDMPKTRKGWLTMRRTFEETSNDGSYVTLVRSFLDARSKDPKRSRPKDMWYVVLKGKVLYLYEDENMTECEAAIELSGHDVVIFPEGLLDGELYARRNAICLKPKVPPPDKAMPSVTREMNLEEINVDELVNESSGSLKQRMKEREKLMEDERIREMAREEALNVSTPWFIFVRANVEMEDWYFALIHASRYPPNTPMLTPLQPIFSPADMNHLVTTIDEQPDVIPMRWLNALLGRLFFSYYRTEVLESYIIGRLMKKLSRVKRPTFLTDIVVTQVSVGNRAPTFSKPMLKELTKEGDASLEVHLLYKGEVRATVEATATINLGARFRTYTVKLVLAAVLRELEGNLLIKVKRPPSSRIWYAFTQTPRMVLDVEPIVSDRQITWSMILNTIESRLKEIIQESIVMPNMDDISYFETSQYSLRGGIWNDASRREKATAKALSEGLDDGGPTPASVKMAVTNEVVVQAIQRSRSAEDLLPEPESSLEGVPVARSATTSGVDSSESGGPKPVRRRSWFTGQQSGVVESSDGRSDAEGLTGADVDRGRSVKAEISILPRSQSIPDPQRTSLYDADEGKDDELSQRQDSSTLPRNPNSSSSHLSIPRQRSSSHSHSHSVGDDHSSVFPSDPLTTRPNKGSRTASSTAMTTSSFLSTLKSKAGDKQALSNSAKEAMRKWGVNWGGLKKDHGGPNTQEDSPDAGPSDSHTRIDYSQYAHRQRPSYADVRAHVAERHEREKGANEEGLSAPIAIPSNGHGDRISSGALNGRVSPAPSSSSSFKAQTTQPGSSEGSKGFRFVAPSVSRTATETNSVGEVLGDEDDLMEDEQRRSQTPSPIHTQPPQAKTMTIPGIHASHRGEVMSMGYVAPAPPPPDPKTKPAIQTVYRLWKSPVLNGQQPESEGNSGPQPEGSDRENNKDVAPLSLSPEAPAIQSRPVPPPLPPRTIARVVATRHTADVPSIAPQAGSNTASPASEALKSIATKDETARRSEQTLASRPASSSNAESTDLLPENASKDTSADPPPLPTGLRPPLPPRRTQVPAA